MKFAFIDAAKAEFPVHRLCGIARLKAEWEVEYARWQLRDLRDVEAIWRLVETSAPAYAGEGRGN